MNVFKNTKTYKKLIIIIIAIMLFSFIIPKSVRAGGFLDIDISGAISNFLFWIERGVIKVTNNIFCDDNHAYQYVKSGETGETTVYIAPETIIKGKFALLDPDIFKEITATGESSTPAQDKYYDTAPSTTEGGESEEDPGAGETTSENAIVSGRAALRNTIAGWYYALRNLALIALLSILVYVAIRMIMSTISQDKAKYKTMLKDWTVAICLVMIMHYIMIGTLSLTSKIVEAIGTTGQNSNTMLVLMNKIQAINESEEEDHEVWLDANGKIAEAEQGERHTIGDAFAYELILLGVIGYTLIFAFKYLMRMMTIVFLVLVAPITAITYPIDKISDGKAQAFNTWLQEFIYQVIIQPFHLLIYVVLVGSATTLATENIFYAIMCFAVMMPAEKFIKQMFGFKDKLSSPLGAFAGGAVASQLINGIKSAAGKSAKTDSGDKGNSGGSDDLPRPPDTVNLPGTEGDSSDPTDPRANQNPQEERPEESYRNRTQAEDSTTESSDNIEDENDFSDESESYDNVDYGGGASAAAAYQNTEDPVAAAERERREEEEAEAAPPPEFDKEPNVDVDDGDEETNADVNPDDSSETEDEQGTERSTPQNTTQTVGANEEGAPRIYKR